MIPRRRSRAARLLASLAPAVLAGGLLTMVFAPTSQATEQPQLYVSLRGEGAWSVRQELVPWQNELSTAKSYINLDYTARGSYFGRSDFLGGGADFAVSGVPFTAAQLSAAKMKASDFIDAPIDVATLAVFVGLPPGGFTSISFSCDPNDPSTWPPNDPTNGAGCIVRAPVPDLKIPNRNVAAMLMGVSSIPGANDITAWNNKDLLQALHVDQLDVGLQHNAHPAVFGRSDPDEINYYMQQFVKTAAPAVWTANEQLRPKATWEPIGEYIPIPAGSTRDGAEQQVDQMGVATQVSASVVGSLAPAPPSTLLSYLSIYSADSITNAALQNFDGQFVHATPETISAAVAAGGDTPLYALTHKVANAYPLVWVDHLYAPAHGLPIDKTEGLAMLIRYLATTGQDTTAAVGEGRLPKELVAKALAAADALVVSNCQGADREVVRSSDPGPLAPATAKEMQSIGSMNHCVPAPDAPSTTTSTTVASPPATLPTGTPATPGSGGPFGSTSPGSGSPSVGSGTSTPGSGVGGTTGGGSGPSPATGTSGHGSERGGANHTGSGGASALLTASKLPLGYPAKSPGGDRLATFLLGVALYLVLRKPVGRMYYRIVT